MNLSQDVRYRPYEKWTDDERKRIEENVARSPWHATYHLEPRTGLLNDPNGFSYFNGKFQLFYQNWPFGAAHGLKQWVHTISDDLVHFQETGEKLLPGGIHDSHGVYSGSAYPMDDRLFLFYTGNVRDKNWIRDSLQVGAWMDKNGHIEKMNKVLIHQPKDVTEHFRDPQIFNYEGQLYTIIGGQSLNNEGIIKLYRAVNNDINNWEFIGNLDYGREESAYMIECPNLLFVDHHPVLIYNPQGLSHSDLDYRNIYPNVYQVFEKFDPTIPALINPSPLHNLDEGFEVYATQGFNAPNGNVYTISWIGLPDISTPTDRYDYQGAMSLVKELHLKEGKLLQRPVEGLKNLRTDPKPLKNELSTSNTYEIELKLKKDDHVSLFLFADQDGKGLDLQFNLKEGKLLVDRSNIGEPYALSYGTKREAKLSNLDSSVRIFVDRSIFEIFINDGEKVLTGRVFANKDQSGIVFTKGNSEGTYYEMKD